MSRPDVESKFPMEVLEAHQSVELLAIIHMGSKSKHKIKLEWSDDFSASVEKVIFATL